MRMTRIFFAVFSLAARSAANAQTVIVPETPYTVAPSFVMPRSTALLDRDSVLMAATIHEGALSSRAQFQVVNIDTGEIELPAVGLAMGMTVPVVAALSPDSGLVVVRDDNDGSKGKYFVVNSLTGAIVRGPIPFASAATSGAYGIAVIDPGTVLIAFTALDQGVFTVVDPQTGAVKVPETPFAPGSTNQINVVMLDAHRVAIAYGTQGPDFRTWFTVVDAQDGAIVRPPEEIAAGGPFALIARSLDEVVLVYYDAALNAGRFLTLNTVTGARSTPVTFVMGGTSRPDAALVGTRALFIGFMRSADFASGEYVVFDLDGPQLTPATVFNPGSTPFISATSSDCRTLISYTDHSNLADQRNGRFQVIDLSDVCVPRPCPPNLTGQLDFFASSFVPFFVPELRLQLVLVRSRTTEAMHGPFSLVADELRNALLLGSQETTTCGAGGPTRFVGLSAGPDDVLSPGELGGAFVLFLRTSPESADPITYRPRILNGVPPR
jgi:hypothetical protein